MTDQPPRQPVRVSPLAVPFLFLALVTTAVLTFAVGPWAGIWLLAVVLAAFALAMARPTQREASVAAVLGGALGFGGVMLLAVLHGFG